MSFHLWCDVITTWWQFTRNLVHIANSSKKYLGNHLQRKRGRSCVMFFMSLKTTLLSRETIKNINCNSEVQSHPCFYYHPRMTAANILGIYSSSVSVHIYTDFFFLTETIFVFEISYFIHAPNFISCCLNQYTEHDTGWWSEKQPIIAYQIHIMLELMNIPSIQTDG